MPLRPTAHDTSVVTPSAPLLARLLPSPPPPTKPPLARRRATAVARYGANSGLEWTGDGASRQSVGFTPLEATQPVE